MNTMRWYTRCLNGVLLLLLGVWSIPAWTQPDWSLTPEDFEFTMTVTGLAQIDCAEGDDPLNMVAAFIDGEVRGVQYFSDEVNGHFLAFMIVYDNVFSGSAVTFKLYDAGLDTILEVLGSVEFRESASRGNSDNPYQFHTSPGVVEVFAAEDMVSAELKTGEMATTITTLNVYGEEVESDFTFIHDALGIDNHYFSFDENQLLLNVDASTIEDDVMDLHILATPSEGCPLASAFQLTFSEETSIGSDITKVDLQIYPNPSKGIVHWNSDATFDQLRVYDLQGRMLLQKAVHSTGNVDMGELGRGVYALSFLGEDGTMTGRVLIEE